MSKQIGKTMVRYKPLFADGESAFKTEGSLDTITFTGCYLVEVNHKGTNAGFPLEDCNEGHYVVGTLIVTDSGTDGSLQSNRMIGQVLALTSCKQKKTNVYSRTRVDDEWSEWRSLAVTGMYDIISTPDELLATVSSLVNENTRAKQVEEGFKRTAVDISSQVCTTGKDNVTLTGSSMDGEIIHSVEIPAATTEKAGVMSAADKVALEKAVNDITEEITRAKAAEQELEERIDNIPLATTESDGLMSAEDKVLISNNLGYIYISNGEYIKVPTIKNGEIVYVNSQGDYNIELYGKTELEDKEYISIYGGSKTADRDINYIKCPYADREYYIQTSKSFQPQIDKIDSIRSQQTVQGFIASTPEIDRTNKSVRIPSGTYVLGGGTQVLTDEDIVGVADSYGTHYVLINMNSKQIRFVQGTATPIIYNDAEVLVGLVRWSTGVIWFNSVNYIENGELIDAKAVKEITQIVEDINQLQLSKKKDGDIFSQENNTDYIAYSVEKFSKIEVEFVEAVNGAIIAVYFYNKEGKDIGSIRVSKSTQKAEFVISDNVTKIRLADSVGGKWKTVRIKHSQDYELSGENRILNTQCIDLKKENLKILDIGNSYTQDSHTYLASILEAVGAEDNFSLYKAVRGSGTFSTWLDCYNNNDGAVYNITHTAGKVIDGIAASGQANDGSAFRNVLTAVDWDIIIIHQVSNYSPYYYAMTANAYYGKLYEFVRLIKETNPQAAIGWLLVHSYAESNSQNTEGWTSEERWKRIADATKGIVKLGIDFVIPYGTAVQNLRASSLNNGSDFSTDGTHLATGLGDYVASCCYYQMLFAPRFGVSITGNTFRANVDESVAGQMSITDETAAIAQKAAMLASYDWYNINKPD